MSPLRRAIGPVVLGLSACGYPLTQLVVRRWGVRGAGLVEAVCTGLALRDTALIASGAPKRLRRGPALLLWLEAGAGWASAAVGLRPLFVRRSKSGSAREVRMRTFREAAMAGLFGLHTVRFWIYLQPDHGARSTFTLPGCDALRAPAP